MLFCVFSDNGQCIKLIAVFSNIKILIIHCSQAENTTMITLSIFLIIYNAQSSVEFI